MAQPEQNTNKTRDKGNNLHINLLNKYEQIWGQDLTAIQALYRMLDQKKSMKKIKVGLVSIGRHQDDEVMLNWNKQQYREQFLRICEQLVHYFEEQRDQSMRSTERSLSEMNEEINKMRKSLSEKGILLQLQKHGEANRHQPGQQTKNKPNQQTEENQGKQENAEAPEEEQQNDNLNDDEGRQENKDDSHEIQQAQNLQGQQISEGSERANDNLVRNQSELQKSQKSSEWQWGQKQKQLEQEVQQAKQQKNHHGNTKSAEQQKQSRQNQGHKEMRLVSKQFEVISAPHANISETYHLEHGNLEKSKPEIRVDLHRAQKQEHTKVHAEKSREPIEWTQIPMPEQEKEKKIVQKLNRAKEKKLYTLPEELDNQFYDQEMKKQKAEIEQKRQHKYNPHLEIMKKLSKNKKEQPLPKNQLEQLYYSYRNKLIKLFSYYLKELKTSSFTFDQYPQSLDLKTFSSYYKHFKLAELCKVSEIPKYFKKYSMNGAWLNETGFLQIHAKILQLADDPLQSIHDLMSQKQKIQRNIEQNLKTIQQSEAPQNEKQTKQKQLAGKRQQMDKKYNEFVQKLNKINSLLSDSQIKKLIRKAEPKPHALEVNNNSMNYDRERLRRIVEAHSGMNKDDIIQKLNERKREKEKRHEVQMHRIIQKYRLQNQKNSQSNSGSSFNKSNSSSPNMHRIQGYAKRNNIKKHGMEKSNIEEIKGLGPKPKYKSEPKIKPYFVATQSPQNKDTHPEIQKIEQKPQIYKQLSLPKLPKRKMREQSIYESLKNIDTKAEIEYIKKMLGFDKNSNPKTEDEKIFNDFYNKERLILEKEKTKKTTAVQNRMKFT